MGCGALQESWREYVRALKKVAHTYGVSVEGVSQMMSPAKARALWKKLCLKTHPDKGGNPAHLREITDAKRKWENLLKKEGQAAPYLYQSRYQKFQTTGRHKPTLHQAKPGAAWNGSTAAKAGREEWEARIVRG